MAINIKNSQEQVPNDIPKIISTTSLMETHNPAVVISVSSKKRRKKRAKNMTMNNNAIPIEDQLDDSLEASNKVGHCEVATNDSPKNLLEKVLSVEPLAELRKMDAGFTENLSEGNANTKIEDKVQSMDPKLTLTTSLMDLFNPAGDISMSSKKRRRRTKKKAINNNGPQIEDQVDDNLKVPNKIGDSEVPNHESQKNLLEAVLTPQPQADHPKMNGGLTANLAVVNNNAIRIEDQLDDSLEASNKVRHCEVATNDSPKNLCEKVLSVEPLSEHRKMDAGFAENLSEGNANTKIEDEVQSMDPKITLTSSLMDLHNPAGDISMSSKKKRRRAKKKATNNNGPQIEDQVADNLKAPNKIGDCEVPNYESQKNLLDTVLTPQPLVEHPKMDGGLTANLSVVNATTKIEDEVQTVGPKIILNASLMETPNPAGYNSLRSKKNTGNQVDDNLEASNKTGDCEAAHNESQKNLFETVLTVQPLADRKNLLETVSTQPLAEHPKIDGGLNLPEGSANSEKRKWQKRIKKKTEIKDDVQSMDPKIILSTSLMETHNFSGNNSVSFKKNSNDQVVDNLEASKKVGDCEVANNDSQKNLFETGSTVQSLAEHPKMDGGSPENLSEGNVNRKKRKKRKKLKKKTGIKDEVLSMGLKIHLNSSLAETQNPSGDNSLSSEKNTRDQADENMEASNRTEYYEVAHNDSQKNVLETVLTVQPLVDHKNLLETVSTIQPPAEHPKIDGGLTANLPEGNANRKKRKWQKKVKKKTEIKDGVQSMDPKIISSTSLMETHNIAGDNSVSIKKNSNDQVVDNLEASIKVGDCEVANNDSQKNLFEIGSTVQSLAKHPKMDGGLPENLSEGIVNRKKRKKKKRIKKKTGIKDEVLSMDLKIPLNSSLTETQNPSGDNSLSSEKNTRDQADDNMIASNRTEYYEVAHNDSQKNVLETVLTVQPPAEHPKMDGGLPENLSEGHANRKKRKWRKRIKKKTEIKDEVPTVDPKIILNTSPIEMQNPAGYTSLSRKKNAGNQVDDNLEASNKPGDLEVAHNDSQKNLLETVLTIQPLAEPPKVDSVLTADLPEGSANSKKRKRRKRIKRKAETKDEVQSMDPKIILSTSLMETQNPAGDNFLSSKRNDGDHVNDNLEASNKIGDCEVANNDSQKILLETVSTEQPLAEHPKMDEWLTANLSEGNASSRKRRRRKMKKKTEIEIEDGVQSMGQKEAVLSVRVDVSSNGASSELLDERSGSLVGPVELEMKTSPCESQQRPPSDQRAGENGKFENESNEVSFENIVVEETTSLCSFDVMKAECLPKDLDQFPNTASITASRKKLLVLDVNGLLAHIVMPAPKDCRGDVHILGRAIFKRPFCDDFLKFCFQNFDVGIWSSRTKKIIDRVVDYLLGDLTEKLLFCWDMSHSTQTGFKTLENTHKPLVCKELRKIWENDDPNFPWKKGDYDESNTLLLDDSPYKALLNPLHTAIFPPSYQYMDKKDDSIGPGGDIRVYLEGLLESGNVREYVEHHPFGQSAINETNVSWEFYSRVLHTMSNTLGNNHPIPVPTLS